ncbi:hypothetical protein GCM10007872_27300 [Gluconobacter sphaericus NBRC 12467]|uniref:Uncharacterized protein n=1 Tax=Gluconobacter sphaericus NBRC 12467 TaxID=1307951 RepID=A0AA37WAR5_9PROT|nr:hypothetical protein AA12467_0955 [Gluconobacter sphaericus NBRC 12467]GEB43040.1 hypothetical protein GSP01_18220 [Gluconobacter sphaericus NBRC 12467]GLQ85820.1 hypothetical protein GCM10007872_27300 [Gluconobacter sphaericus NBRC 12467]
MRVRHVGFWHWQQSTMLLHAETRHVWPGRIGQKMKLTRWWAKQGIRPRAVADLRTRSAWIFGARHLS